MYLMFDAEKIRAGTFVRHIEIHDTIGSTNDRAADLARQTNIELPALVVARHQTAGRGRGDNRWWAADGALTFSLLLDPATTGVDAANWPQLSLASAVAVCDALSAELNSAARRAGASPPPVGLVDEPAHCNPRTRADLGIKWPNDVFLDGRKVCGILIESPGGAAPANERLIVGIGINVNNSCCNAPLHIVRTAAAVCDVTLQQHDLQSVLIEVLAGIDSRIAQVRSHDNQLVHDWQRLNLLAGKDVFVERDGHHIEGRCNEIADDGSLIVGTGAGIHRLYSGSVRHADEGR